MEFFISCCYTYFLDSIIISYILSFDNLLHIKKKFKNANNVEKILKKTKNVEKILKKPKFSGFFKIALEKTQITHFKKPGFFQVGFFNVPTLTSILVIE